MPKRKFDYYLHKEVQQDKTGCCRCERDIARFSVERKAVQPASGTPDFTAPLFCYIPKLT